MTDEAEVVTPAPEDTSAPETTTEETGKPAAETAQEPEAKAKGADEENADPADEETDDEGEPKPKKRTRTSQLRSKIAQQALEIDDLRRREAERASDPDRQPPKEEDFNGDYERFNRAQIAFEVAETLRKEQSKDTARQIEARRADIQQNRVADHMERVEDARKTIPDYDAVLEKGLNLNLRPETLELIIESEKSAIIAYHLAEKPDRVRELAGMTTLEAAKHIGKLEARLSLPKAKSKTEAPAPIAALKGGAAPTADPAKMSMAEYAKWREAKAS